MIERAIEALALLMVAALGFALGSVATAPRVVRVTTTSTQTVYRAACNHGESSIGPVTFRNGKLVGPVPAPARTGC